VVSKAQIKSFQADLPDKRDRQFIGSLEFGALTAHTQTHHQDGKLSLNGIHHCPLFYFRH
jgi:hypothetical protein